MNIEHLKNIVDDLDALSDDMRIITETIANVIRELDKKNAKIDDIEEEIEILINAQEKAEQEDFINYIKKIFSDMEKIF